MFYFQHSAYDHRFFLKWGLLRKNIMKCGKKIWTLFSFRKFFLPYSSYRKSFKTLKIFTGAIAIAIIFPPSAINADVIVSIMYFINTLT